MGVILFFRPPGHSAMSTPHTHGGDSNPKKRYTNIFAYSPYTWGKLLVNCQWLNKIVEKGRFKNA